MIIYFPKILQSSKKEEEEERKHLSSAKSRGKDFEVTSFWKKKKFFVGIGYAKGLIEGPEGCESLWRQKNRW